jgi:hypothetical protein
MRQLVAACISTTATITVLWPRRWRIRRRSRSGAAVAGSIHQVDVAAEFERSLRNASIADDLSPLIRAMFIRCSDMHHVLVALAAPTAVERFGAAGVDLPGIPQTAAEREELLGTIRRMIGQ